MLHRQTESNAQLVPMLISMGPHTSALWWLVGIASLVMTLTVLRAIGRGSVALAGELVDARRTAELKMREENAAAEAAGRAAALEPLALNADGTIEEPILGVVETQQI